MKRCPTCNKTFDEDWLSFCTQDGATLVETASLPREPPPTMMAPPMPPSVSPTEQPTLNLPGSYTPPPIQVGQPQPPAWQPPAPPAYAVAPQQSLAITSLALGIFSMTIGFCCYLGVITAPIAIGLGSYQLVQIKNYPTKFAGKPLAITGIVTGSLYFVILVLIILVYGVSIFMRGIK